MTVACWVFAVFTDCFCFGFASAFTFAFSGAFVSTAAMTSSFSVLKKPRNPPVFTFFVFKIKASVPRSFFIIGIASVTLLTMYVFNLIAHQPPHLKYSLLQHFGLQCPAPVRYKREQEGPAQTAR